MHKLIGFFLLLTQLAFAQNNCFTNCAQRAQSEWEQLKARGVTSTDSALLINQRILESLKSCDFPKVTLNKVDGGTMSIDNLKGNIVFVHFWFTTCATCIAEMPTLKKLETDFKADNVSFLAIAFNDAEKLKAFFKKRGDFGSIQTYLDQKTLEASFCILDGYPLNMILDKNGKVIDAWYEENPDPENQTAFYNKVKSSIRSKLIKN